MHEQHARLDPGAQGIRFGEELLNRMRVVASHHKLSVSQLVRQVMAEFCAARGSDHRLAAVKQPESSEFDTAYDTHIRRLGGTHQ